MRRQISWASLIAIVSLLAAGDLLACGDKFLVGSRGTRYQRPKNVRAASILIYANPEMALGSPKMLSVLKREGHHATTVSTFEQLSSAVGVSRFDVILAATDVAAKIQQVIAGAHAEAIVLTIDTHPNAGALLTAIDKAVEQHDQDLRKNRTHS